MSRALLMTSRQIVSLVPVCGCHITAMLRGGCRINFTQIPDCGGIASVLASDIRPPRLLRDQSLPIEVLDRHADIELSFAGKKGHINGLPLPCEMGSTA